MGKKIRLLLIIEFLLFSQMGIFSVEQSQEVASIVLPFMKEKSIPGLAVCVFKDNIGKIYCYGYASLDKGTLVTQNTIFDIASITKVFTATDLALQVQKGKISLSDPVVRYLPEINKNEGAINKVTLLQLATHSSSLPRVPPGDKKKYTRRLIFEFLQNWEPDYPIGTHYIYSNLAFGVIGFALENVQGAPYEELIEKDILLPLGMNSTMIHIPYRLMHNYAQGYLRNGQPVKKRWISPWQGGGALRSTPADMLKFLEANLGIGKKEQLLAAMQMAHHPYFRVNNNLTLGLGWERVYIRERLIIDKNGGVPGFSSYIGMIPDRRIGVVILANKAKTKITVLGRKLLTQLANSNS